MAGTDPQSEWDTNMFLTKNLIAAQRAASERVAQGKTYSVELPIVGRVPVPRPEQLAIYAALGGLAVLELIDWPVALAMGVGSALVSRHLSELENREDELAEAIEPPPGEAPRAATVTVTSASARKAAAREAPAKKAPAKPAAKKPAAKKPVAKKASAKTAPRKAASTE